MIKPWKCLFFVKRRLPRSFGRLTLVVFKFLLLSWCTYAQELSSISQLKSLSIEELMELEVTTVSRTPQKLTEVPSAIQVITREDIIRSGATNIPEALRLASNLQVAQLNSSAWIISARGFNTVYANKLLVLIDGRSVYTPLFGGVLWDTQHVLLEDVEQIEVISGPGGTMWGANAVNGVINIITRKARDTEGLYLSAATGPTFNTQEINPERKAFATPVLLKRMFAARYGQKVGEKSFFRVYGQHTDRGATFASDTTRSNDSWNVTQAGFRFEHYPSATEHITVQGDFYKGMRDKDVRDADFDGQNILTRWSKSIGEKSDFTLQLYWDRYYYDDPGTNGDEMNTYDVDFQHRYKISRRSQLLWGLGYRHVMDHVINHITIGLLPNYRTMPMYTAFVQNETHVNDFLILTLGSKFQHNFFTGMEFQPTVRLAAQINSKNTVWGAISEAVRTPSRMDVDYYLFLPPEPAIISGDPENFVSERVKAYEIGYRVQPTAKSSLSLSSFYNDYDDVYSVEALPDQTFKIMNGTEAETWGAELAGTWQAAKPWRIRTGFTYFDKSIRPKAGRDHDPSYLTNDVKHQAMLQSMLDITPSLQFDLVARYLDYIPASFATVRVPEYFTFDIRIAYQYKFAELSVVGQNLWKEQHSEFGSGLLQRSVFGKVTCRF